MNSLTKRSTYALLIAINVAVLLCSSYFRPRDSEDYRAYYVAGQAAKSPATLYDWNAQKQAQKQQFKDETFDPFFHPPLELLLFAPLSKLGYAASLFVWRILALLCLILSGWILARTLNLDALLTTLMVGSLYPVYLCFLIGQDALLTLLILSGAFYFLRRESDIAAAILLSLMVGYKPQLPVILALALFALGKKRFTVAFVASSVVITTLSIAYMGRMGVQKIIECTRISEQALTFTKMPTIRGIVARTTADHHALVVVLFLLCLVSFFPLWRKSQSLDFTVATAICLSGFASPHLFAYDLTVLAIPLLLILCSPEKNDARLVAVLCSAPLFVIMLCFNLESLLIIPTIALCATCFRLQPQRGPVLAGALALRPE